MNLLALKGCVSDKTNQNLTNVQKLLLRAHFCLGHIGFKVVQWLGHRGVLGKPSKKMAAANLQALKCAACLRGKQTHVLTLTKHVSKDELGNLLKGRTQ